MEEQDIEEGENNPYENVPRSEFDVPIYVTISLRQFGSP